MNTINLQDTKSIYKNVLYFYMLTISHQKEKLRIQSSTKRIKYIGIKLTKEVKNLYTKKL